MSCSWKKKLPEFQWATPLQEFLTHRSCAKGIGEGALVQRRWLSEQENKAMQSLLQPDAQVHLCSA